MNNYRWGYREAQAARLARRSRTSSRICLLIAFVLAVGVIVVGCMAGV